MFKLKLPVNEEARIFIDEAFAFFESIYGMEKFLSFPTVLPTQEYFLTRGIESFDDVQDIFDTVCRFLEVDSRGLVLFASSQDDITEKMKGPGKYEEKGAAGLYFESDNKKKSIFLAVNKEDTLGLVATMVHEICHHILLGSGYMSSDNENHEYYTDLLTIYLGFTIFTSHAAFQTAGFSNGMMVGWYSRSTGYLSLRSIGYASALYAIKKGITRKPWEAYFPTTVKQYYDESRKWLQKNLYGNIN